MAGITELIAAMLVWLFDVSYPDDDIFPIIPVPETSLLFTPVKCPFLTSTPITRNLGRLWNTSKVFQDFECGLSPVLRVQKSGGSHNFIKASTPVSEYRKQIPIVQYLQKCRNAKPAPQSCKYVAKRTQATRLRC